MDFLEGLGKMAYVSLWPKWSFKEDHNWKAVNPQASRHFFKRDTHNFGLPISNSNTMSVNMPMLIPHKTARDQTSQGSSQHSTPLLIIISCCSGRLCLCLQVQVVHFVQSFHSIQFVNWPKPKLQHLNSAIITE